MINLHLPFLPPKNICPLLTSMNLPDMHLLLSRPGIGHHDSTAEPAIPSPVSYPPNTGRKVEIILLHAVGVQLPC
jgi:hypothetical protein